MTIARAHAELILHHGTIHTLDPAHPLAEAIAVSNGKILAVGALDELETLAHANTRRIDLQGRTLIPGFNDAHIHLWKVGMLLTQMIDTRLAVTPTIPAIVDAFRARAAQTPVGSWLTGRGYHELTLPERRHPTRHDLDAASTAHPIQLIHTSAHAAVVNSHALVLAGITRDTPNPPGGEIGRDDHGEPTGLLRETAMSLVDTIIPPLTPAEFEAAVLAAAKVCLSMGITSIGEPGITPDQIAVYRALKDARRLPLRANVMALRYAPDNHKLPLPERYESDWLRIDTVKLFADGGLSTGTAALSVPYPNQNGKRGLPRYTDEQLLALVWDIHRAGLRAATHAIGDAAVEQTLKAVEYAAGRLVSRMRHRIEHFGLPNAAQLARARHRVSVVPQAVFLPALGDGFLEYTPPELLGQVYPLRAMKDAGLTVALSSDAPVVPNFNPLLGIKAAADRLSGSGKPIAPDQAIEVAEALRMYTLNGAAVAGESALKGSLSPGKLADMVVLSGDPLRAPVARLTDLQVELTILNGQIVYSAWGQIMRLKQIAEETVASLARGAYTAPGGNVVDFMPLLNHCVQGTQCYKPETLVSIREQVLANPPLADRTEFELVNETTLQGAARIVASRQYKQVGVLNFASAKHPGGGFLSGAKAQEESLARSSGLYPSLLRCSGYYTFHRRLKTCLYSDWMIFSPDCPILRTDQGDWLETPFVVSFITSPAPNAGAIQTNEPHNLPKISATFRERLSKLLALAVHQGCDALVLGAWGCGAFRNDPQIVAPIFWEHLGPKGPFWARFKKVQFSVLDTSKTQTIYHAFGTYFAEAH